MTAMAVLDMMQTRAEQLVQGALDPADVSDVLRADFGVDSELLRGAVFAAALRLVAGPALQPGDARIQGPADPQEDAPLTA